MVLILGGAALFLRLPHFFLITLLLFTLGAFISATHDIAVDGFYLLSLSKDHQAMFVGIRSFFYRMAMIFGSGFLVYFAGKLEILLQNISLSWTVTLGCSAILFIFLSLYHRLILPFPKEDVSILLIQKEKTSWKKVFDSYFSQEKIGAILAFILLYRLGEGMLVKMVSPFFLDLKEAGGLAMSTSQVGMVYGTFGVLALILGGILGGVGLSKFGLKKCLWPMALALNLPDVFYVMIAYFTPSLTYIYPLVFLEQFGYGLGYSAFSVFLMRMATRREYPTSHFAISTGLMALGMMIPGMISGTLQKTFDYPHFFIIVCLATLPGMLVIPFLPIEETSSNSLFNLKIKHQK